MARAKLLLREWKYRYWKTSPVGKKYQFLWDFKKKKKKSHRVNWRTCKVTLKEICKIFDRWPCVLVIFTNHQATKLSSMPISETWNSLFCTCTNWELIRKFQLFVTYKFLSCQFWIHMLIRDYIQRYLHDVN